MTLGEANVKQVERTIAVTGSLLPDEVVTISSEVPGRVISINADFGQRVHRGQVIAELDKREAQWRLDRTRSALTQALARMGLHAGQEEVAPETTAAIRQAEAALQDAKFKYENAVRLVKSGDISQGRYQELEANFNARQAALDAARDDLRTQIAAIQALRAEVRLAEKAVSDTTIRAPFDGAIAEKLAAPGQFLRDNAPIARLMKTHPLRLRVEIPESAAAGVRHGSSLVFTTSAAPGMEFEAVVREVNPGLEAASRSLMIEGRLTRNDPGLKPGMFVQVTLVTEKDANVIVVPRTAVHSVAGLTKVFTIRDGLAREHRITPGRDFGEWIEIPGEGVRAGDKVATSNLSMLVDGVPVRAAPGA